MKHVTLSEIEDELLVCPYCMGQVGMDDRGCCGESSCHFETAYEIGGELYLDSEVTITEVTK